MSTRNTDADTTAAAASLEAYGSGIVGSPRMGDLGMGFGDKLTGGSRRIAGESFVGVSRVRQGRSANAGEVLPFPPAPSASVAGRTMQESVYRRREPVRHLPEDAPNLLIVLTDDAGAGWGGGVLLGLARMRGASAG